MKKLFLPEIQKDLQTYLDEHLKMELIAFNLSAECSKIGYPGFSHFFQVQAQDELLHKRRIANFILTHEGTYQLKAVSVNYKQFKSIKEIMEEYYIHRKYFSDLTTKLANNAKNNNDLITYKFYDWFIIDFYEELGEIKDIIDWIDMSNGNHYKLDRKMLKRAEPNTQLVIDPFTYHQ